ncbi:MAG: zinc-ribbon domain-containing protein [Methanobrevibacter sp.]|nr:zinc-ribbon domain-containing protein [Methanobrevibacter sp.]
MKYCGECGFENSDEAKFCMNCGKTLNEVNQEVFYKNGEKIIIVNKNNDSHLSNIYKTEKNASLSKWSKSKITRTSLFYSMLVFVIMFLYAFYIAPPNSSFPILVAAAIVFALVFAVPVFAIGYIIGWIVERILKKTK